MSLLLQAIDRSHRNGGEDPALDGIELPTSRSQPRRRSGIGLWIGVLALLVGATAAMILAAGGPRDLLALLSSPATSAAESAPPEGAPAPAVSPTTGPNGTGANETGPHGTGPHGTGPGAGAPPGAETPGSEPGPAAPVAAEAPASEAPAATDPETTIAGAEDGTASGGGPVSMDGVAGMEGGTGAAEAAAAPAGDPAARAAVAAVPPALAGIESEDPTLRARLKVAADRFAEGDVASAISQYRQLAAQHPGNLRVIQLLARALASAGDEAEALGILVAAAARSGDTPTLAQALELADRLSSAVALPHLRRLAADFPQQPAISARLGFAYADTGDHANAERYMQWAVVLSPRDAAFRYNLAVLMDRMGARARALHHYQAALDHGVGEAGLPVDGIRERLAALADPARTP